MARKVKKSYSKLEIFLIIVLVIGYFIYDGVFKESYSYENTSSSESNITVNNVNDNIELLDLNIYFVDVGQADSILINYKSDYMLIDAGNNEDGQLLVNYFKSLGITSFKYVVGTHAHEDHIGGMDNIIKNFDIDKFYMPDAASTSATYEDVIDALTEKNYSYNVPKIDSSFYLGNVKFTVVYTGTDTDNLNDSSIVLLMDYNGFRVLFTGDASSKVEKLILDKDIKADVLKVGHHGSQYSTTAKFLNAVNPKYAVISVGKNNSYGHPKDVIINRLKDKNITIYRTDELGTIILSTDGTKVNFGNVTTETNG